MIEILEFDHTTFVFVKRFSNVFSKYEGRILAK